MDLTLNISYNKNGGLVMSPSNVIDLYLSGIPLCYPNGGKISNSSIEQKIQNVQKALENQLSIKINKQLFSETKDFVREEFFRWGFVKTTYLIREPESLDGMINNVQQVHYPKEWLSCKRGDDIIGARNLFLIPNTKGGAVTTNSAFVFSGITPHMGFFGGDFIPNYWKITYQTGWCPDEVPADILDFIGKFVAVQILAIAGDLIYGAGIGNQSVSLDGISQQYSTTKGGGKGAFAGRIQQYAEELDAQLIALKAEYLGMNFRVL